MASKSDRRSIINCFITPFNSDSLSSPVNLTLNMRRMEISKILEIGAVGLGFLFALLSYYWLRKEQCVKSHRKYIRLSELVSLHHPDDENSYFYNFWETFYESPERVRAFLLIEKELSTLNDISWCFLKEEAKKFCVKPDERRGWNQLFEKLNEAKGYCFLKLKGCSRIRFIPRANKNNIETPDLVGWRKASQVLCEVKTINISDDLLSARRKRSVMCAQNELTAGLANKLKSTITKAASQLNSYSNLPDTEKYIYIVIAYDDELDYKDELNTQTRDLFNTMNLVGVDLVIHNEAKKI